MPGQETEKWGNAAAGLRRWGRAFAGLMLAGALLAAGTAEGASAKNKAVAPAAKAAPAASAPASVPAMVGVPASSVAPYTIETTARQALLLDMNTGAVLLDKDASVHMPTSSMSKLMTIYMVFEALKAGRLHLDDALPVSRAASQMGGSKTWVAAGSQVKVEDLIRGVIVQSGNDAAVVLAEGLAGSEDAFARKITQKAHELGMKESNFTNATGWPDPSHYSTCFDLAILARHLIEEFPQYYHYFSETEFSYRPADTPGHRESHAIEQGNRNPLLYRNMGVDGLKTGHTEDGGYGLTASAQRNGRRLILIINGLANMQERADEPARLLEWGFQSFEDVTLLKAGDPVETAKVWLGTEKEVPLTVSHDVVITIPGAVRDAVKVTAELPAALPAPVRQGDRAGVLKVTAPGMKPVEVPLYTAASVAQKGFFGRLWAKLRHAVTSKEA